MDATADPYRWLENPADPRTVTWATEQDRLARATLDALPGRAALAGELERLLSTGWISVPAWRNGRAFFTRREPDGEHAVLYVRETGPDGGFSVFLDEYGTADDPTELDWLRSYSPYHQVQPGISYPAVLFTVFDSDTRGDPLHTRKMCAALQHATTADPARAPVLIRREIEVGHAARAVSRTVPLTTDQLCFLAHYTGLDLEAVRTG